MVTERGYPAQFAFRVGNTITILSVVPLPRTESYGLTIGSHNIATIVDVVSFDTIFCSYGAPESSDAGPVQRSVGLHRRPLPLQPPRLLRRRADLEARRRLLGKRRAPTLPGGLPDLTDPAWLTASVTSPAGHRLRQPAPRLPVRRDHDRDQTAAARRRPGPGRLALGPRGRPRLPAVQRPDRPRTPKSNPKPPRPPSPKTSPSSSPPASASRPSSADGLGACSDQASDPAGDQVHYDTTKPVTCPDSSKIGTAVATSPLLALRDPVDDDVIGPEPIPGDVYLLKPHPGDLPIGGGNQAGKFRLLIQLENARPGSTSSSPASPPPTRTPVS